MPLGLSGCCQERDTLFRDVFSFLMTVTGEGAVGRHSEGGSVEVQAPSVTSCWLSWGCMSLHYPPPHPRLNSLCCPKSESEGDEQEIIYSAVWRWDKSAVLLERVCCGCNKVSVCSFCHCCTFCIFLHSLAWHQKANVKVNRLLLDLSQKLPQILRKSSVKSFQFSATDTVLHWPRVLQDINSRIWEKEKWWNTWPLTEILLMSYCDITWGWASEPTKS